MKVFSVRSVVRIVVTVLAALCAVAGVLGFLATKATWLFIAAAVCALIAVIAGFLASNSLKEDRAGGGMSAEERFNAAADVDEARARDLYMQARAAKLAGHSNRAKARKAKSELDALNAELDDWLGQ